MGSTTDPDGCGKSRPTATRSPDHPDRSESEEIQAKRLCAFRVCPAVNATILAVFS